MGLQLHYPCGSCVFGGTPDAGDLNLGITGAAGLGTHSVTLIPVFISIYILIFRPIVIWTVLYSEPTLLVALGFGRAVSQLKHS